MQLCRTCQRPGMQEFKSSETRTQMSLEKKGTGAAMQKNVTGSVTSLTWNVLESGQVTWHKHHKTLLGF